MRKNVSGILKISAIMLLLLMGFQATAQMSFDKVLSKNFKTFNIPTCKVAVNSGNHEPELSSYLSGTSMTITRSSPAICSGQSVTITWTYNLGTAPLGTAQYSYDNTNWVNCGASPYQQTETLTSSKTYYGRVIGNTGNLQLTASPVTVTVYTISATTPSLTAPVNTSVCVSSPQTFTWTGTVGSHPSSHYQFQKNGENWVSTGTATSYSTSLTQGANTWRVRYYDACSGQYYTSAIWTVYYYPSTICGTINHNGDDWVISSSMTTGGTHTNIDTFKINSGVTVYVDPNCHMFNVEAGYIENNGTINGNGAGASGGGGGTGGIYAYGNSSACQGGYPGTGGLAGQGPGGGTAGNTGGFGSCVSQICGGFLCIGNRNGYAGGGGGGSGGSGGSYGGRGAVGGSGAAGSGGNGAAGGTAGTWPSLSNTYGTDTGMDISYGSGGGGGGGGGGAWDYGTNGNTGGAGGAQVSLISYGNLMSYGTITCDGSACSGMAGWGSGRSNDGNIYSDLCTPIAYNSCTNCPQYNYTYPAGGGGGGSGGSGGGIKIMAYGRAQVGGTISADGGEGGRGGFPWPNYGTCVNSTYGGGGGGGGRIKIIVNNCETSNSINSNNIEAAGGSYGGYYQPGSPGSYGTVKTINNPNTTLLGGSIAASGSTTVCSGASNLVIDNSALPSGGTLIPNYAYEWGRSTSTNTPPTGFGYSYGYSSSLTYTPAITTTTHFIRDTRSGGCRTSSNIVTFTVVSDPLAPTATKSPNVAQVCAGETLSLNAITDNGGGTGSCSIEYRYSTNNGTTYSSWSASIPSFQAIAGNNNKIQIRKSCSGLGCDAAISEYTWGVTSVSQSGTVSSNSGTDICAGSNATLNLSGNTGSIQWQSNASGSWQNISGATGATYTSPAMTSATEYRAIVTNGVCPSATSNALTISIIQPDITGIDSGDYIWTGAQTNVWNTTVAGNWLVLSGGDIIIPGTAPDATKNVIIRKSATCFTAVPTITSASIAACNNLTVDAGNSLTINVLSNIDIAGNLVNQGTITAGASSTININGNWDNQGVFNPGSGTVEFGGSFPQSINHSGSGFNNVTFNNSSPGINDITLESPINIAGNTVFANGVVNYSGSGYITFGNAATTGTGGNANSYINGAASKTGSTVFVFPIGEGLVFAQIGIAAPATMSTITAEYNFSPGPLNWSPAYMCVGNELHHTSGVEHWLLTTTSATPAVTLYWADGVRSGIEHMAQLRIAHYNAATQCWENKGGVTTGNIWAGTITSTSPFTSYSPITFGTSENENPLPVELSYFEGFCNNESINLQWITSSEINNDHFEIERSVNGSDWKNVGIVDGAGNSNSELQYSFADRNISEGIIYYRLRQVDYDGSYKLSNIVQVRCAGESVKPIISIYPNPFSDEFSVNIENWNLDQIEIEMFDMLGKKIGQWTLKNVNSHVVHQLNPSNLPPAMYLIKIKTSDGVVVRKVEKK